MRVQNDILIPELARLLAQKKEVRFTPSGTSMRPFIEGDRDSVVLAPLASEPKRGDILLAKTNTPSHQETYVLHRLINIQKKENNERIYILMGDGNLQGQEYCSLQDIIGRVKAIEKPDGTQKYLSRGIIWYALKPIRKYLLKIYRHTMI